MPSGAATGPQPDRSAAAGPNAEAEGSAAHIAELVRRTSERDADADATSAARTERTVPQPVAPAPTPPTAPARTVILPAVPAPPAPAPSTTLPAATAPAATAPTGPAVVPATAQPSTARARSPLKHPFVRFLVAGGALAAVLIAAGFAFSSHSGSQAGQTSLPAAAAPAATSAAPAGYAAQVTDEITDCEHHSHGRTRHTFRSQNCVKATRALGNGRVDGRPVLFVVARIQMKSSAAATSVRRVLDGTGTGNLNDLLREGKTFQGAPEKMPRSGYASARAGAVVLVAEAGFSDGGPSSNDDPALREAAAKVAAMLKAQG